MKYIKIISLILISIIIVGCGRDLSNITSKTSYKINETAKIDKLEITLTNFKYLDNDIVEFTFKITNNRDNSITLNPDNNFKIYNSTNAQIPNIYSNDSNIIKSKDTMNYTLQYNIKNRELYEILFYSGIVENNIKFTVTNNDIK
ncbi:MAG TPA: hypothetical protein OIM65_04270 [Bacilli bacterium]|jgi:lipoprotein|nr:hypothetical protein [Bacilli bacterium]